MIRIVIACHMPQAELRCLCKIQTLRPFVCFHSGLPCKNKFSFIL